MLTEQKSQSDVPDTTPVLSSTLNPGGMVDEKKNTLRQITSTPEALPTATTRCLRSARLPTILYFLSLIIGFIATGLTLSSDARNENDVPSRAIYAFIFFIAAMLFDAGRIDRASAAAALDDVPDLEPADLPDEEKENTEEEEKAEISTDSPAPVEFQELKKLNHAQSASVIEMKELKSNSREEKSVDDDSGSRASSQTVHVSLSRPPTYLQRAIATGRELMPAVWAAQAFSLFIQNAIEEPLANFLMPYTTLTGLAAGYVFHVYIKHWPLWGIRNWIFNNRNSLAVLEFIATAFLFDSELLEPGIRFSVTTAAFWTGYNTNEFTTSAFKTLFSRKLKPESFQSESLLETKNWGALPSIRSSMILTFSGASLMTASIILLVRISPDSGGILNFSAQSLASIGGYLLTYPIGIYLGHMIIAKRLHKSMLTICTYLLVPFAAPGLTIPHYFLLAGAGLCGGVAHTIINNHYSQKLALMQQYCQTINAFLKTSPGFLMALHQQSLPEDALLKQEQKKRTKIKILSNSVVILYILDTIIEMTTTKTKIVPAIIAFYFINSLLAYSYLLPYFAPSIYRLQSLSKLARFFYINSFSMGFLTKIFFILFRSVYFPLWYKQDYSYKVTQQNGHSATLYIWILAFFPIILSLKVGYKGVFGGYLPYVPRASQIDQLKVLDDAEKLRGHITAGHQTIRLSYHLLKFIRENCQMPAPIALVNDNASNIQLKEASFLREEKGDDPQRCRHSWSPRLQWQAVPVVHPFSASDPQALPTTAIAILRCGACQENILTCELGFDEEDLAYNRQRFDADFEYRAQDAAIRGSTVASQFAMGLPQGLSLSEGVTSFTL